MAVFLAGLSELCATVLFSGPTGSCFSPGPSRRLKSPRAEDVSDGERCRQAERSRWSAKQTLGRCFAM